MTDGDGDTATATANFPVTDANAPSSGSAAAAVDDDGLPGGNPASTTGDLNANVGDDPGDTSEATFTGTLGGSVGGDGAGANGFSFAGLNGNDRDGRPGDGDLPLEWRHQHADGDDGAARRACSQVQITDPATGAYKVTLLDNVLHATGPNDENIRSDHQPDLLDHRCGRLDRHRHADRHLRRRCADGDGRGLAECCGRRDGHRHAGLRAGRRRRHGHAHRRHGAGVQPGDGNYSQAIDIGDGSIKVKADGSYSFTADAGDRHRVAASATFTVTDGDGDTATATSTSRSRTPTRRAAAPLRLRLTMTVCPGATRRARRCDLNANIGDDPGDTSEATFTGTLGGSVGGDGAGANGFSFAALNGNDRDGRPETVTYSWNAGTHTLTATITSGRARHELFTGPDHGPGDRRLQGDAARQRHACHRTER